MELLTTLPKLNKILEIAEGYYGINESSPAFFHLIDFYNTITPLPRGYRMNYSDSWCAAYVSVVMRRAGIENFPYECGCSEMFNKLRDRGCHILGRPPMPGEIVFFKSSHVGIVNGWGDENWNVPTIEGNSGDMCAHRNHNMFDKNILGWCSPYRYSSEEIKKQIEGNIWGEGINRDFLLKVNNYKLVN